MDEFVSFVIPTLNSEPILSACLESIRGQTVPADRYEILVADGGSRDGTVPIARRHGCRLIEANGLLAEAAKQAAFREARGGFIALVDADNELAGPQWLRSALAAIREHSDALGLESYYLKHPRDTRLNRLLTAEVLGTDPCVRSLSRTPRQVQCTADGVEVYELPPDGSYPTGANGFLFRKDLLSALPSGTPYHEAAFFPALIRSGRRRLIKTRNCGVYHHYVRGLPDFLRKRRRNMINYLLRKQEVPDTWDSEVFPWRKIRALAYNGTIVGPLIEGVCKAAVRRDAEWLLYGPAAAVSVTGILLGLLDYRRMGSAEKARRMSMRLSSEMSRSAAPRSNE
jgi:glycosyltransferase involved in cell wall biosynthesis